MTDCSLFLCSFKQSKSAVRLKEDMKKIVAAPLSRQKGTSCQKVFGVSLQDLQQQGLIKNGIPKVVWDIVEYLTRHGKLLEKSVSIKHKTNLQRFVYAASNIQF